jgi:hypothetical protein
MAIYICITENSESSEMLQTSHPVREQRHSDSKKALQAAVGFPRL